MMLCLFEVMSWFNIALQENYEEECIRLYTFGHDGEPDVAVSKYE
jgi:hypothetical protein